MRPVVSQSPSDRSRMLGVNAVGRLVAFYDKNQEESESKYFVQFRYAYIHI
jgi:hypothetical protein